MEDENTPRGGGGLGRFFSGSRGRLLLIGGGPRRASLDECDGGVHQHRNPRRAGLDADGLSIRRS